MNVIQKSLDILDYDDKFLEIARFNCIVITQWLLMLGANCFRFIDRNAEKTFLQAIISHRIVEKLGFLTLNACGPMPGEVILFLLRSIHSKLGIPLNASSEIAVMLFPRTEFKKIV